MLTPGKYTVRASIWTYKKSAKDNWYLALTFNVVEGEQLGEPVRGNLNFAHEAQSLRSQAVMRHLGWTGADPAECLDNGGDLDRNAIDVLLEHQTVGDRRFLSVKDFILPNDVNRAELSQFLARFKTLPAPAPNNNTLELEPR